MMRLSFYIVWLLVGHISQAQPNIDKSVQVEGVRLYTDIQQANVYYAPPAGITIAKDRNGTPDLKLVMMRYTGRRLSQDQQKKVFKNLCQFRVILKRFSPEKIKALKTTLGEVEIKNLPLSRSQVFLIYAPILPTEQGFIRSNEIQETPQIVADEQSFTIVVSNEDAQLLGKAFQQKQTLISVGYALFAEGISQQSPFIMAETGAPNPQFKQFLDELADSLQQKAIKKQILVSASATEIMPFADINTFIKKIDINEQLPAEFAAIDVRCYDFNNELRPDLYAKKVEVEAIAIDDKPTFVQTIFYKKSPDDCVKNIKFNYAIKLENPLRYRITEINESGQVFVKGWTAKPDWGQLDITGK